MRLTTGLDELKWSLFAGMMWKVLLTMGRAFSGSAQIGRMQSFGKNGSNLGLSAFSRSIMFYYHNHNLIGCLDPSSLPLEQDHSQTLKTRIPIPKEPSRWPALPLTTMSDGYGTKVVQSMLREYCIAHICGHPYYLPMCMLNMLKLGFITGNKKQVIP